MIPKVSIIVPIHNAGSYLKRCLDTLINQTLREIEIICILDYPTDGSDTVVEKYAALDNRIKLVYNSSNLHIGLSRNIGLTVAAGEYIGFSDHDDYRELSMYEQLYNKAKEKDADVCLSNQCSKYPDRLEVFPLPEQDVTNADKVFRTLVSLKPMNSKKKSLGNIRSVWNQIFKRSFIEKHDIRFPDTKYVSHEDTLFCTRFYAYHPIISYCPANLYYWMMYETSTIHSYSYGNIINNIRYIEETCKLLKGNNYYKLLLPYVAEGMIRKLYSATRFEKRNSTSKIIRLLQKECNKSELLSELILLINKNLWILLKIPPTKILFYLIFIGPAIKKV